MSSTIKQCYTCRFVNGSECKHDQAKVISSNDLRWCVTHHTAAFMRSNYLLCGAIARYYEPIQQELI